VGPRSAGAMPGPACYGKGGTEPTVTDCALVLGRLDPAHFLGGAIHLDVAAARSAVDRAVAEPLGLTTERAAASVIAVATENMVQAILDITVNQGIDPASAILIAGGGAAGLNSTMIGRRLGCPSVLVPSLGAALSAAGALMSELTQLYRATCFITTEAFDFAAANGVLSGLQERGRRFIESAGLADGRIERTVEARYANQVWEIEVPLELERFEHEGDVLRLVDAFHAAHEAVFAIRDLQSPVEIVGWTVRASCRLSRRARFDLAQTGRSCDLPSFRRAYFEGAGFVEVPLHDFERLPVDLRVEGPAIVESPFTTIIVDPGARARKLASGSLLIEP
jgi:N-methylhydantoinase A